jgi:sulfur-oxidizing protein SoxX
MRNTKYRLLGLATALTLAGGTIPNTIAVASSTLAVDSATMIGVGREIAFDRARGNCLACHKIEGGDSPGNIGPALVDIKTRYPDKEKLRARIWDATIANPTTAMPPFGGHQILSDQEIDQVAEFIWSK